MAALKTTHRLLLWSQQGAALNAREGASHSYEGQNTRGARHFVLVGFKGERRLVRSRIAAVIGNRCGFYEPTASWCSALSDVI